MKATKIKISVALSVLVAVGATGTFMSMHHTQKPVASTTATDPFSDDPFADKNDPKPPVAVAQAIPAPVATQTASPAVATAPVAVKSFARANNIGLNLAQELLDKKDYKGSIAAQYEGYRSDFYPDNIGQAIGFGLNDSMQTKSRMSVMAKPIINDAGQYSAFVAQAGEHSLLPASKSIHLNPEQALAFLKAMFPQYDSPAQQLLGANYDKLTDNEKAALMYHSYKSGGFSKFKSLSAALVKYASNPTPAGKQAVISNIHYTYLYNGKRLEDTRGSAGVQAMFDSPEAYAALIGKNPSYISTHNMSKEIPALAKVKIDDTKDIDAQIPDPVGDVKQQYFEQGKPVPISSDNIVVETPKATHNYGGPLLPKGWF